MLKSFRGMAKGVGAWILAALIILTFAVVGVPQLSNYGKGATLQVGDERFTIRDVEREFNRQVDMERRENGRIMTREDAIADGIVDSSVNALLLRGVFQEEADALGVTVTDSMVQRFLNAQEGLQNSQTGRFDATVLQRFLRASGMSIQEFRARVREDLLRSQIESGVAIGNPASATLGRFFALRQTEERIVKTALLPLGEVGDVAEDALRSFYAANIGRYSTPERRTYTLVTLSEETLADRIAPTDEAIAQRFAAMGSALGEPEKRSFTQAQFASPDVAQRVVDAVTGGMAFVDAVQGEGGRATVLADQRKSDLIDPQVATAIFEAASGALVGPIEGEFGFVVATVSAITPATTVTLDDVRQDLEDGLREEYFSDLYNDLYDQIQEAGDAGEALADAAAGIGVPVRTVGPADRDFVTAEGLIEDNVPLAVHQMAFTKSVGALFEEVDLPDGGTAFVELSDMIPATPQAFETVSHIVRADYLADRQDTAIQDLTARFDAAVAQGTPFDVAAIEFGGEVVSRTMMAFEPSPDVPRSVADALFSQPIGEVASGPSIDGASAFVAQVESVRFAPNGQIDTIAALFRNQFSQAVGGEMYDAYIEAAQADFGVKRNAQEISKAFSETQ